VLDWVSFNKAALHNCVFIGCNITNSTFKGADLSTCIFDTNVFCLDNKFDGNTEFPPQYAWVKKLRFNALTDREQAKVWQDYPGDGPEGEDYITMLSFEYCGKL